MNAFTKFYLLVIATAVVSVVARNDVGGREEENVSSSSGETADVIASDDSTLLNMRSVFPENGESDRKGIRVSAKPVDAQPNRKRRPSDISNEPSSSVVLSDSKPKLTGCSSVDKAPKNPPRRLKRLRGGYGTRNLDTSSNAEDDQTSEPGGVDGGNDGSKVKKERRNAMVGIPKGLGEGELAPDSNGDFYIGEFIDGKKEVEGGYCTRILYANDEMWEGQLFNGSRKV